MGKMIFMTSIIVGIIGLLWLTGIYDISNSKTIIGLIIGFSSIETSTWLNNLLGTLLSSGLLTFFVGFTFRDIDKTMATAAITTIYVMIFEIAGVLTQMAAQSPVASLFIYGLLAGMVVMTALVGIEWWRGKD